MSCVFFKSAGVSQIPYPTFNMANVKACFAMPNLKLEVGVPPGPFSQSILIYLSVVTRMQSGTYQPQRPRLLSDVNVFGGLFLC